MDLKSGYPFWVVKNGLLREFPPLRDDVRCDVAIVGGGITGALIADELTRHGHHVAVIEQRDIGWGSTAASTALVQYEIDTHLVDLASRYGDADAALAYQACADAVERLGALAREVRDVGFHRQDSLYFASKQRDVRALETELRARMTHGLPTRWLDRGTLRERYGIAAPGALLTNLAGVIDPYRMTHRLLARVVRRGGIVCDRSVVDRVVPHARGVEVRAGDVTIRAKYAVLAAGYANERWLAQRVAKNRSSYAYVTDPIDQLGFLANTLVWETARPYLYMRTTPDHRLLVGGEDDAHDIPARRDARVDRKAETLRRRVVTMFPDLPLEPTFAWAGTFAETKDGLPFFGAHPSLGNRVLFAMAYGGNGITYSVIGAALIRAAIERQHHALASLFSFARLDR
ncbi:MAG: FAD-dependent oxidoreductase [Kofleriaceae bacterium]